MQLIVGVLVQIINVLKEVINRLLGLIDLVLFFLGFQSPKKLRLRVVVLRDDEGQPLAEKGRVEAAVETMTQVFKEITATQVIPTKPMIVFQDEIAPHEALNVHCDDGAWQEDFGPTGAYFRRAIARNLPGIVLGYGAPVTVFVVDEISGKGGCSLGPLTDYVTQEARTLGNNRLMAHEVAHACGLWHSHPQDETNLMYPKRPGTLLTKWQVAVFRNSRHVTYL